VQPNRRKSARHLVAVTAEIDIADDTWVCETRDISAGGVSLALDHGLKEGENVELTLILTQDGIEDPQQEPFQARAEVIWSATNDSGKWIAGLRFLKLGQPQSRQLERFLKAFPRQEE
jgi:c-di-GMP-binding flagellar brake protein YcgR